MCTLSLSDSKIMLDLDPGDLETSELDACLRAECAGYVLDAHSARISRDWLRRQLRRGRSLGGDGLLTATIVAGHVERPRAAAATG